MKRQPVSERICQAELVMSGVVEIRERRVIEAFLRRNAERHVFEIGDLDERFWPHTTWYGWHGDAGLEQIALLYQPPGRSVLLMYGDPPLESAAAFARDLVALLPQRMYAHLGVDLVPIFEQRFVLSGDGLCLQMNLKRPDAITEPRYETVVLTPDDASALAAFYAEHDPVTQFDTAMLSTLRMRGVKQGAEIIAVAGLHVYSKAYSVAALGGVATHAAYRRKGLGTGVTAALCTFLLDEGIETIALDVMLDNTGAISIYEKLGFERGLVFRTGTLEARS